MWYPSGAVDDRVRLIRVIAAGVLVLAGWSFGFLSGRMSAWIFPIDPRSNRFIAQHEPTAKQPHRLKPSSAEDLVLTAVSNTGPPQPQEAQQEPLSSASSDPASTPALPSADVAMLVRPSEGDEDRERAEPRNQGHAAALDQCAKHYSSFRRSDGTYQPYGDRSRVVCPYLRFRN
jgi:hypothetical protein